MSGLERQGVGFVAIGIVAVALGGMRGRGSAWRQRGAVAVSGVLFFGVPAELIEHARTYTSEMSVAVVFALAPVVVVLVWGAVAQAVGGMRQLLPPLIGLAGVLLLLPFELPVSGRAWEAVAELAVAMVLVASAGVWLYGLLQQMKLMEAMAVIGISNAALLLAWRGVVGSLDWRWRDIAGAWWVSFASMVVTVLTVWLLQRMEPVRFSARFLVVPLVTILEGLVLLRPEVTARMLMGGALLAGGAAWMLMAKPVVDEEVLTLR